MKDKDFVEKRLGELKTELAAGEKMMSELAAKQASLQQTMLRISGAIQVLEEVLDPDTAGQAAAPTAKS